MPLVPSARVDLLKYYCRPIMLSVEPALSGAIVLAYMGTHRREKWMDKPSRTLVTFIDILTYTLLNMQ